MTLIAAFRTKEGIAICADSQETVPCDDGNGGTYEARKTVQKIAPISTPQYQIAIAGSGDADLIETFIILAERRVRGDRDVASIERLMGIVEDELGKFYEKHVDKSSGPSMKLFVAATCLPTKKYETWVSESQYLRPLRDAELIGWDEQMYWVTTKRLYRKNMTLTQAVLAAVHVLVIGEESSNYIKGPFSVSLIRENGIWTEDDKYVNALRDRLTSFETYTNQILLACADTSLHSLDLETAIQEFAALAKTLHEQHIDDVVNHIGVRGFNTANDAISKLPPGMLVEIHPDGKIVSRHDVNGPQEMVRRVNEALKRQHSDQDNKEGMS